MPLQLDLQFFAGEKTEKATPKKREDSRKKGQVAKSQDLNTAFLLLFSFIVLSIFGHYMKEGLMGIYTSAFTEYIHWEVTPENVHHMFVQMTVMVAKVVAPIMFIAMIAGLAANFTQVGFMFTTEPLKFDLKKIDPIKGAKKIFSLRALVELVKSLLKISLMGIITFGIIWMYKHEMMMLAFKTVDASIGFFGKMTIMMGIAATIALFFIAIFDYTYQRYDFEKSIKMSKQDIKDEHKNMEGDPLIKSKMKERQRQMATNRMMSEVPEADVVITNPTHFAVAIKYDENKASAPYVVAKGVDHLAFRIKKLAKESDVTLVENRPLARALYAQVDTGQLIPEDFFQAVAEVLAYVYRMEKKV